MTLRNSAYIFISLVSSVFTSCSICIGGGELKVEKNYVYNKCGLLNGVSIREIEVDSFQNNIPTKYTPLRLTVLRRKGSNPNNVPKRLYFVKDSKEIYLYNNNQIVDTVKGPMIFRKEKWYLLKDDDTEVFMFIDKSGNRQLSSQQNLKVNF